MTPRNKQTQQETTKRSCKRTNDILEDHGSWLLVDISTPKHPDATMAVDEYIFNNHTGGRIFAAIFSGNRYIYACYKSSGKNIYLHRKILPCSEGVQVDHKTHGTKKHIDNRRSNLRMATRSQNQMNNGSYANSNSGILGVSWHKNNGKWHSQIRVDGVVKCLGYYDNIDFAIGARKQAEREYFGDFAFKGAK